MNKLNKKPIAPQHSPLQERGSSFLLSCEENEILRELPFPVSLPSGEQKDLGKSSFLVVQNHHQSRQEQHLGDNRVHINWRSNRNRTFHLTSCVLGSCCSKIILVKQLAGLTFVFMNFFPCKSKMFHINQLYLSVERYDMQHSKFCIMKSHGNISLKTRVLTIMMLTSMPW